MTGKMTILAGQEIRNSHLAGEHGGNLFYVSSLAGEASPACLNDTFCFFFGKFCR